MRNDWYGWVKKKLNASPLAIAAPTPSQTPPLAATTGGISRISATVPVSRLSRNGSRQMIASVISASEPAAPKRRRQMASSLPADAARSSPAPLPPRRRAALTRGTDRVRG